MRRVPIASDADRVVAGGWPLTFPLCRKRSLTEQGCTPIAPIPGYQGPHRVLSRCPQPRSSRGEDEPTQTDVAMELFEVVACDEQDLLTLGVVESSRRELCESR